MRENPAPERQGASQLQMFAEGLGESCYLRMGLVVTGDVVVVGAVVVVGTFFGLNL